jgi:hypothetical protein
MTPLVPLPETPPGMEPPRVKEIQEPPQRSEAEIRSELEARFSEALVEKMRSDIKKEVLQEMADGMKDDIKKDDDDDDNATKDDDESDKLSDVATPKNDAETPKNDAEDPCSQLATEGSPVIVRDSLLSQDRSCNITELVLT